MNLHDLRRIAPVAQSGRLEGDRADRRPLAPFVETFAALARADAQIVECVLPARLLDESGMCRIKAECRRPANGLSSRRVERKAGARKRRSNHTLKVVGIDSDALARVFKRPLQVFLFLEQPLVPRLLLVVHFGACAGEPLHVAAYVEAIGKDFEKPTVKQHLAAIRMCFDWLVTGGVLATNPAHAVRGPKHVVKRGKTPVLTSDQARALLDSIDTSTLVGLRDRALIGVMTYAFARIGAVVTMRVEDYIANGKRWWVRLHEKGGKRHEMPAHHKLEAFVDEYIPAAGIGEDGKSPLFRSALGRTGLLNGEPCTASMPTA